MLLFFGVRNIHVARGIHCNGFGRGQSGGDRCGIWHVNYLSDLVAIYIVHAAGSISGHSLLTRDTVEMAFRTGVDGSCTRLPDAVQ
jgi:hypothetical protein